MLVANKDLRAMVMGGHCHLDIVAAIQLMRVVVALRKAGLAAWDDPKGSAVSALRAWMLEHGWVVHTEWTWSAHNFADLGVDLTQADSVVFTVVAHRLRMGWRWWTWGRFLRYGRHECGELNFSLRDLHCVDFRYMRAWAERTRGVRSAFLGSVLSPACFRLPGRHSFSDRCVWGCGALGTWEHLAWTCPDRPSSIPKPDHTMTARFGWIFSVADHAAVDWIGQVVEEIWKSRYG